MVSSSGLRRRLLLSALWRRRAMVAVTLAAIALAAAMVEAAWMVSRDVSRKLTRELRALGPNLVLMPEATRTDGFADESALRERLRRADLEGAVLLYALVNVRYLWETGAKTKTEGQTLVVTATFPIPSVKLK